MLRIFNPGYSSIRATGSAASNNENTKLIDRLLTHALRDPFLTQVWPFHPENQKFHHYF